MEKENEQKGEQEKPESEIKFSQEQLELIKRCFHKKEKPKSWPERKQEIKHKWLSPLIYLEWLCEWLSYLLGRWAFLDILGHIGRLAILVAIISYFIGAKQRQIQAENQRKAKQYQAWEVINIAKGSRSSGGRISALQDLNKDKVSLRSVDLSNANLKKIDLDSVDLADANLSGADLKDANFSGAYFDKTNLLNVRDWRYVKSIKHAIIYDVNNPPDGFTDWAKEHGAKVIESEDEFDALFGLKAKK